MISSTWLTDGARCSVFFAILLTAFMVPFLRESLRSIHRHPGFPFPRYAVHRSLPTAGLAFLLSLAGAQTALAQTVTTAPTPNSESFFIGNTSNAYQAGQSFGAIGTNLTSVGFFTTLPTFWSQANSFEVSIFAWNGSTVTGDALFTSNPFLGSSVTTGWNDFATGGTVTTIGGSYLALVRTLTTDSPTHFEIESSVPGSYSGGAAYYTLIAPDPSATDLAAANWLPNASADMDFRVTFAGTTTSVTPEPATLGLLATGLVGISGAAMRRRRGARRG